MWGQSEGQIEVTSAPSVLLSVDTDTLTSDMDGFSKVSGDQKVIFCILF